MHKKSWYRHGWFKTLVIWGVVLVCASSGLLAPTAPAHAQSLVCPPGTPAPPTPRPPPPCTVALENRFNHHVFVTVELDDGSGMRRSSHMMRPGDVVFFDDVTRLSFIEAAIAVPLGLTFVPSTNAEHQDRVVIERIASFYDIEIVAGEGSQELKLVVS